MPYNTLGAHSSDLFLLGGKPLASPCRSWPLLILPEERRGWEQSVATRAVYVPGRFLVKKRGQVAGHRHGEPHWMQLVLNLAVASRFGLLLRAVGGANLETECQVENPCCRCRFWPLLGDSSVYPPDHRQSLYWQCIYSEQHCHLLQKLLGSSPLPSCQWGCDICNQISISCLCYPNCPCLEQPPTPWRCPSDTVR